MKLVLGEDVGLAGGEEADLTGLTESGEAVVALGVLDEVAPGEGVLLSDDGGGAEPVDDLELIAGGGGGVGAGPG